MTTDKKVGEKGKDGTKPKRDTTIVADGGRLVKMEVDYTSNCDEKIPEAKALGEQGKVKEAVESLMLLEKQTRTGGDAHSTSRVLVALVEICFDGSDLELLNETVVVLTKKRSQIKMAVTKMVQKCCEYVDKIPDKETKLKLMDTLRTVTAGKIYVEVERARLTHKLALMKEGEGDIEAAATAMQEMAVETYGSMERKEKVEIILEQMRLCLLRKDHTRTQIISKKISTKFFDGGKHNELKLKYYRLMIELDGYESKFMNICKHYLAIFRTEEPDEEEGKEKKVKDESVKAADEAAKLLSLRHAVLFLVLAPHDNEQHDMLYRIRGEVMLKQAPLYSQLLKLFSIGELIKWSGLVGIFETELRDGETDVFRRGEEGEKRWTELRHRVVEHNIRMMAKYYTRVKLDRMAELLDLAEKECESFLCALVVSGSVVGRIDRLAGIVTFGEPPQHADTLNQWLGSVHQLMALVNKTTHLINKEQMQYNHLLNCD